MWTLEEAISFINEHEVEILEQALGRKYLVCENSTESWEHGWIISLAPLDDDGYHVRYVVDRNQKNKCVIVGTRPVRRAIARLLYGKDAGGRGM